MSVEQHAAIVRYAEENSKEASFVTWDTVEKDGGLAKWRVPIEKPAPNPKAFPILGQREGRQRGRQRGAGVYAIVAQRETRLSYRDVMIEAAMGSTSILSTGGEQQAGQQIQAGQQRQRK